MKFATENVKKKPRHSNSSVWFEPLEGRAYYSGVGPSAMAPADGVGQASTVCTLTVSSTLIHAPYESETFTITVEPAGAVGVVFLNEGLFGAGQVIDDAPLYGNGTATITMQLPQFNGETVFYASFPGASDASNTVTYSPSQSQAVNITVVNGTGTGGDQNPTPTPTGGSLTPVISKNTLPVSVIAGEKTRGNISVTVQNTGATAVGGNTKVKIYATTAGTVDSSSIELGSVTKGVNLKAGRSKAFNFKIKQLPSSLTSGTYTLVAQVTDADGTITTSPAGGSIAVADPVVNITGTGTVSIPEASVGEVIKHGQITAILVNNGNIPSVGIAKLDIDLTYDSATPGTFLLMSVNQKISLKPGKSMKIKIPVKSFPMNLATAIYKASIHVTVPTGETSDIPVDGKVVIL